MRGRTQTLLNTPDIELWPGGLLKARSNRDARLLARAHRVLRRKRDGRYLAAVLPEGPVALLPKGLVGINDKWQKKAAAQTDKSPAAIEQGADRG